MIGFTLLGTLSHDSLPSLSFFDGMGVAFIGCTAVVFKVLSFVLFMSFQLHLVFPAACGGRLHWLY